MKKLTIEDIEVPEEAIRFLCEGGYNAWAVRETLKHFALWLAENPIVPSEEESHGLREFCRDSYPHDYPTALTVEWQRRMFLKKQDALPEEVKKLIDSCDWKSANGGRNVKNAIAEAYKLGKEAK